MRATIFPRAIILTKARRAAVSVMAKARMAAVSIIGRYNRSV